MEESRARAKLEFSKGSPKSRKAAVVVVTIWVAILALAAYLVLKLFK